MRIQVGDRGCDFRPWRKKDGKVFTKPFALDTETTRIVGHAVPDYVLGAACDGQKGYFLTPGVVHDFLEAHRGVQVVFHNCAFDLAVLAALLERQGSTLDVYGLVDRQEMWDTQIMHRLYSLATAGHTCQGKGQSTLEACVERYLGLGLPKEVRDAEGDDVRLSWGKWLGKPPGEIPSVYLEYLGKDVVCTHRCFEVLLPATMELFLTADRVWGYVDHEWMNGVLQKYGPLTHDLQAMAAVALDRVERRGFGLDLANRNDILCRVQQLHDDLREQLRQHGYLEGEKGCDKALQALVRQALQQNPGVEIPLTETGRYSTREEDLDALAGCSEFFGLYKEFRQVRTLLNNYLAKMGETRIHPHYDLLKNTGRTGSRAPNIQGYPKKSKKKGKADFDIRRCFVPAEGKLFYVVDYSSIELRTLSQAVLTQFRLPSRMAEAINGGADLHRLVAARMKATGMPDGAAILADPVRFAELASSVSKSERNAAKPANFGLPAGMGVRALKEYARVQYDQPYTDEDARSWLDAWLASFPEMESFRADSFDAALALARELNLTPGDYSAATGEPSRGGPEEDHPAAWLGGMALKVLKEESPSTGAGRPYTEAMIDYFWQRTQPLAPRLKPQLAKALCGRQPSRQLSFAAGGLLNRSSVFTITGRLRAKATYSARRNTVFQGAAADGAKLALYRLWRAGFQTVAFIHDEVVVEVDADCDLWAVKGQIDDILVGSMREICPDIRIEVEGGFRRRWGKEEADEVALPKPDREADAKR